MNIGLFIGGEVGTKLAPWLIENYKHDITFACIENNDEPCYEILHSSDVNILLYRGQNSIVEYIRHNTIEVDLFICVWFAPIFKQPLLNISKYGIIGMHPAYLPYTRGANFNIWPLVEQVPFGVSLFWINDIENGIDTGDIVAQKEIPYTWEDTGATLRTKAPLALIELFKETYPKIRTLCIPRIKQDLTKGTTHYKSELDTASQIYLDKMYSARDLLNWIRARTFPGYPACHFTEHGVKYEVRVEIRPRSLTTTKEV